MKKPGKFYFLAGDGVHCFAKETGELERLYDTFEAFYRATTQELLY